MRHYLIDFENTHTRGLKLEQVKPGDFVHIFYSKAASKLDMSMLPSGVQVTIDFFEVLTGKQALDMQLSSYLGYLVSGTNGDRSIGITIVSCDTDYDTVVSFWKKHVPGLLLERMGVKPGTPKKEKTAAVRKRTSQAKSVPREEELFTGGLPDEDMPAEEFLPEEFLPEEVLPEEVTAEELPFTDLPAEPGELPGPEELSEPEEPSEPSGLPEALTAVSAPSQGNPPFMTVREVYVPEFHSPAEEEDSFAHILNTLQEEEAPEELPEEELPFGAPDEEREPAEAGSPEKPEGKSSIKKTAGRKKNAQSHDSGQKAEEKPAQKTDARTELNNQIIQALSRNRVEANTAGAVAKLILAHQNEKNAKQLIYREIIKSYKQEKGLQIYNLVKTLF